MNDKRKHFITRGQAIRLFVQMLGSSTADGGIEWPPEKTPSHEGEQLQICYDAAWIEFWNAVADCIPLTQVCVDAAYRAYEDEILTCESNYPE